LKNHGRSERVMVKSSNNCDKMAEWIVDVVGMLVGVNVLWMLRRRVANLLKKLNCHA